MNAELTTFISTLRETGFSDGNAIGRDGDVSDMPVKGLVYLRRVHPLQGTEQYQYLSVVSYEGRFLEAVLHVYDKPFQSKGKVRQIPLCATILRTFDAIVAAVSATYPPLKTP